MKSISPIVLIIFLSVLTSCQSGSKDWSELPDVTPLNSFEKTEFVVALESPISINKNVVYAPSLLFAWDAVRQALKSDVVVENTNSAEFRLLQESITHKNALTESEYSVDVELEDGAIRARAFFNKTLPFGTKLQEVAVPISFGETNLKAFGMQYYDEEIARLMEILYYKNDNTFILKLIPKDNTHEIILIKGLESVKNLAEAIRNINGLIDRGRKEKIDAKLQWRYEIADVDIIHIPVVEFNIETNFRNLERQSFLTKDNRTHSIDVAYQRTGFILNENGAVAESESYLMVDSVAGEPIITHPKKMIFDKPFYIVLRRKDGINPYFVMKVENAELLIKK